MSASSTSTPSAAPPTPKTLAAITSINKALGHAPPGYILDLRSNPGGLLDQAVGLSDVFLERGEIVSQRGREQERYRALLCQAGRRDPRRADDRARRRRHRLGGRDRRRRAPGPSPRGGHGRAQLRQGLGPDAAAARPTNTALRLTTARYYTPSGRSVQEGGIAPGHRGAAAHRPRLQGPAAAARGRSAPPPDQRGEGRERRDRGRRQARSALRRHRRRAEEEGRRRLSAPLRASRPSPACRRRSAAAAPGGSGKPDAAALSRGLGRGHRDDRLATAPRRWRSPSPAALLAGAYGSQYFGGHLFPCEMCWWQRYAHFAALAAAILAYALSSLPTAGAASSGWPRSPSCLGRDRFLPCRGRV